MSRRAGRPYDMYLHTKLAGFSACYEYTSSAMFTYIVCPFQPHTLPPLTFFQTQPLPNPICHSPSIIVFHWKSQELLVTWFEPVKVLVKCYLFFMTKVPQFLSPVPERGDYLAPAFLVWVLVLGSRGHLCSCPALQQVLTGCLFSLAEGCCLPFLCVGIPALGKGMEDEAGYLRQTRGECDSRWSNELSIRYMFPGMGNSPPRMESLHHSSSTTSLLSCCLQDQQVVWEMLAPGSQPTFLLLSFFARLYSHTSSLSYLQTPLRPHLPWKPSQTSLWSQSLLPLRSHSTVCSLDFDTSHMVV